MRRRTIVLVLGLLVLAGVGYLVYRSLAGKTEPEPPNTSAKDTEPLPTIVVEAAYPEADALAVADTVAAPVERKVKGVEGLLHMRSQSASDGTYTLTITFQRGTDLNAAQVLVQNRLDLARPNLPDAVKQSGFRVRKEAPGALLIATLSAPEGRHDRRYLSNYADSQLKDTLARLAGVARVRLVGQAGEGFATLGGKPVVALVLSRTPGTRPRDIRAAVETRLTELRAKLPEGLALDPVFDPAAGPGVAEDLGIDVVLPDSASTERTLEVVRPLEALTRAVGGVRDVLALSESPFDRSPTQSNRAYLLVRLEPAGKGRASRESIVKSIRSVFDRFPDAVLRLRDLGAPGALPNGGYAVRLAVHTAADLGMSHLQATADALARGLNEKPALTDVFSAFRAGTPQLRLDIDRKEAARRGVAVEQIMKALQAALGQNQTGARGGLEEALRLKARNGKGEMVPLGTIAHVTVVSGPTVIDRLDLEVMAEVTANLAPSVSPAEARALCEEEARTTLPKEYRLTWLSETPPAEEGK